METRANRGRGGDPGADTEREISWVCKVTAVVVRGRGGLNCERGANNGELRQTAIQTSDAGKQDGGAADELLLL